MFGAAGANGIRINVHYSGYARIDRGTAHLNTNPSKWISTSQLIFSSSAGTEVKYLNGFKRHDTNVHTPSWGMPAWRREGKLCILSGLIRTGCGSWCGDGAMFELPRACRPTSDINLVVQKHQYSGGINIRSNGLVYYDHIGTHSHVWMGLNGISFLVKDGIEITNNEFGHGWGQATIQEQQLQSWRKPMWERESTLCSVGGRAYFDRNRVPASVTDPPSDRPSRHCGDVYKKVLKEKKEPKSGLYWVDPDGEWIVATKEPYEGTTVKIMDLVGPLKLDNTTEKGTKKIYSIGNGPIVELKKVYVYVTEGSFKVLCDFDSQKEPQLVMQRRGHSNVEFHRNMKNYELGFPRRGNYFIEVPNTYGWQQSKGACEADGKQMCTHAQLCPNGWKGKDYTSGPMSLPADGVQRPYDRWTPVADEHNTWVSIGNTDPKNRMCGTHVQSQGSKPSWGTAFGGYGFRGEVMCCEKPLVTAVPIADTTTYEQANQKCQDEGKQMCSYKDLCPNGKVWVRPTLPLPKIKTSETSIFLKATPATLAHMKSQGASLFQYKYVKGDSYYISPETNILWDWNKRHEVTGEWTYYQSSNGTVKTFACKGSSETDFSGIPITDYGGTPPSDKLSATVTMAACEGDCDKDDHCTGSLKCFQRDVVSDLVPGCASEGYYTTHDYCYDDKMSTKEECGISCSNGEGGDMMKLRAMCSSGFKTTDATLSIISDQPNAFDTITTSAVTVYIKSLDVKIISITTQLEPRFLMKNIVSAKSDMKMEFGGSFTWAMPTGSLEQLNAEKKFGMSYVASSANTFSIEKEGETSATTRVSKMIVLPASFGDLIKGQTATSVGLDTTSRNVGSIDITSSGKWYITSNWRIQTKLGNTGFCRAELGLVSGLSEIKKSGNSKRMLVERVSLSLSLYSLF